jgi:hypothetical protein
MTSRAELERRVDELAAEHSGRAFAAAIRAYDSGLDAPARELLKEVLLERAADFDQALMERVDSRGWFRRQWDRAGGSSPHVDERHR